MVLQFENLSSVMNWENIQTIAQFDGRELETAETVGSPPGNSSLFQDAVTDAEVRPTVSTSLLIESLIQLLCLILENDEKLAQESYKLICEQLNKINLIDDSFEMNEFEDIRSQYQMQIYNIICAVRGQDMPISLPSSHNTGGGDGLNKSTSSVETCWSRYHREFEEIGYIAGGGFGKVFKARHKLDCIEYAVKQIKIHSTTIKLCHLTEVKTIAKLNHPNIVQYKAAWLEPYLQKNRNQRSITNNHLQIEGIDDAITSSVDTTNDDDDDDRSPSSKTETESSNLNSPSKKIVTNQHKQDNESSDFIQFESTSNGSDNSSAIAPTCDENNQSMKLHKNHQSNANNHNSTSSTGNKALCKYSSNNKKNYRHASVADTTAAPADDDATNVSRISRSKTKLAILYIQMSLCQLTLRTWLNERNSRQSFEEYYSQFFGKKRDIIDHFDIVHDIFCQILSGLSYIHSQKIVHHDIKPSNIFLGVENDGKLCVQLGDFGLACPLQKTTHHGIGIGTELYAAPEQLRGECNPKSDIYSLGIVLLELLLKFNTEMERTRIIHNARKGNLPIHGLSKQFIKLLGSLLSNVKNRPTTKELCEAIRLIDLERNLHDLHSTKINVRLKDEQITELKQELKSSHSKNIENETEISNLLLEIDKRDEEIMKLKKLLAEKDKEIIKLKKKYSSFKIA